MNYIKREQISFDFSKDQTPALTIKSGENVTFQTHDCFSGQITSEEDLITEVDFSKVNPATGPVYVEEAEPGDILKVEIHDIQVRDWGVICSIPDLGVLNDRAETKTKIVSVEDSSTVQFNDEIKFAANPMVGVIGVAPAEGSIPTGLPGNHGGNIDNHVITKGSTVYLPVNATGAYFGLGDVHASMGDGEISGTGIEISGEVDTTISVIKGKTIPRPMVETKDSWYTVAIHEDTQSAIKISSEDMQDLLVDHWNLSPTDAYLLMSVAGDVEICQCCKPSNLDVVTRFRIPKLENMTRLIK